MPIETWIYMLTVWIVVTLTAVWSLYRVTSKQDR